MYIHRRFQNCFLHRWRIRNQSAHVLSTRALWCNENLVLKIRRVQIPIPPSTNPHFVSWQHAPVEEDRENDHSVSTRSKSTTTTNHYILSHNDGDSSNPSTRTNSFEQLSIKTDQLLERISLHDNLLEVGECYWHMKQWLALAHHRDQKAAGSNKLREAQRANEILLALETNRNWKAVNGTLVENEQDGPTPPTTATNQDKDSIYREEEDENEQLDGLLADLKSRERRKLVRKLDRKEETVQQLIEQAKGLPKKVGAVSSHTVLVPNSSSFYDVVLQAFAVCGGGRVAAESAEDILDRMLAQCRRYVQERPKKHHDGQRLTMTMSMRPPPEPTTKTFNVVMNAWSKSGVADAGVRAEAVLSKMARWKYECDERNIRELNHHYKGSGPSTLTWLSIMNAWACRSTAQSRTRVVDILHKIKAEHDRAKHLAQQTNRSTKKEDLMIGPEVCNTALKVFVDQRLGREEALQAQQQVLKFYQQWHEADELVLAPNERSYGLVMNAWALCGTEEGARQAEAILDSMISLHRQGVLGVLPNRVLFAICISAWARLANPSPENAERLLQRLVELYEETGDESLRPDSNVCNHVVSCWARSTDRPDAIDHAKQVFESAKHYAQPDLVTYNTLLDGISRQRRGSEAMELLQWLESAASSPLAPDRISYNTVIAAIGRDPRLGPKDVLHILDKMKERAIAGLEGGLLVMPDKRSYTGVFVAWNKYEKVPLQDAEQAVALVHEMEENAARLTNRVVTADYKPDAFLFTQLLLLCSKVEGTFVERQRALELTLQVVDRTLSSIRLSSKDSTNTFEAATRAIRNLCDDHEERAKLLRSTLDKYAARGFVVSSGPSG